MGQIFIENGTRAISQAEAMRWFCWSEIVRGMERDQDSLRTAMSIPQNIPDWEEKVLESFLELTEIDINLGY